MEFLGAPITLFASYFKVALLPFHTQEGVVILLNYRALPLL